MERMAAHHSLDALRILVPESPTLCTIVLMSTVCWLQSGDWLHNIISIPTSITLRRIFSHLFANTLLAVVVWWMTVYHPSRIVFLTKGLTTSAHGLISGALGLMLVFRTNSAYDRYPAY
jgi:predicted membrane chloride channel (bestrophin family)